MFQLAIESYDSYMVSKYRSQLGDENSIFSKTAISSSGYIDKGINLSLLSDDDIICFLKNDYNTDNISRQFFDRSQRLKPLWKSEIEFRDLEDELLGNSVARSIKSTLKAIKDNTFYINDEKYNQARSEKTELENTLNSSAPDNVKSIAKNSLKAQENVLKIYEVFHRFSSQYNLENNFAFIFVDKHYESNYVKLGNEEIYIEFSPDRVIQLKDALSVKAVDASDEEKNGYYYIFTSKHNIDIFKSAHEDISRKLFLFISQNW